RCQNYVTALGASYPAARQCILAHQDRILEAAACARTSMGNMCADSPGQLVTRRNPLTLQLAAFREMNTMLVRSGVLNQATALLQTSKGFVGCMMKCGKHHSCDKGCGISLPPDNVVIANVKSCAFQAGFTIPVAREICGCLVDSGVQDLAPICPKLTIS
ncbi:hypothetical protein PENTCL1PPCAC_14684, partial [Pristionchus entomophagus]